MNADDALRVVLDEWQVGINERDPARVAAVFTDDAIFQGLKPYSVGRHGVERYYASQPLGMTVSYRILETRSPAADVDRRPLDERRRRTARGTRRMAGRHQRARPGTGGRRLHRRRDLPRPEALQRRTARRRALLRLPAARHDGVVPDSGDPQPCRRCRSEATR